MGRTVLLAAAAAGALAACSTGPIDQTPSPPAQSTCAGVSDLVLYPYSDNSEFTGFALARAWHVWFSAFGPVPNGKAVITLFGSGVPTKVVIHTDSDLSQPVVLTGIECSTGAALHFCYNQPDNCADAAISLAALTWSRVGIQRCAGCSETCRDQLFWSTSFS